MPLLNNVFIFINVREKKYARYVARGQREVWFSDQLLNSGMVEQMRMNPESLEEPKTPEAA